MKFVSIFLFMFSKHIFISKSCASRHPREAVASKYEQTHIKETDKITFPDLDSEKLTNPDSTDFNSPSTLHRCCFFRAILICLKEEDDEGRQEGK